MRDLALDSLSVVLFHCDELVWDFVLGFDVEACEVVWGLFDFLYFDGVKVFVLAQTMKSFPENCVLAGFVIGFVFVDCTIFEKAISCFCSNIFLVSKYVILLVTLTLIISFSFFQISRALDLER